MIKKSILFFVAAALAFWGCGSDSSSSPEFGGQSKSSLPEADSSGNGQNLNFEDETGCKVEKLSGTSVRTTLITDSAKILITVTVMGATQEIEYYTTYNPIMPDEDVRSLCEENKQEAAQKNATVECDKRSIRIKETTPSLSSLEALVESANDFCKAFNAEHSQKSENGSMSAICIMKGEDNSVLLKALAPDSLQLEINVEYDGNFESWTTIATFMPNVSQSAVENVCDNAKANAVEYSETGLTRNVTCVENVVTVVEKEPKATNTIPEITLQLTEFCNTIEGTGKFPK